MRTRELWNWAPIPPESLGPGPEERELEPLEVSETHLQVIVNAAIACRLLAWLPPTQPGETDADDPATMTLRMLADENERSVACRSNDESGTPSTLVYSPDKVPERFRLALRPVEVLSAIRCLRYHSCDSADWLDTPACEFLQNLTDILLARLPGANDVWHIDA